MCERLTEGLLRQDASLEISTSSRKVMLNISLVQEKESAWVEK